MFKILSEENQIQLAQEKFHNYLIQSAFRESVLGTVNCMGGKFTDHVFYSPELEMWYFYQLADNSKHWHAFGMGNPHLGKGLRINSEMNMPKSGINRSLSACFAEDENQRIYLLHRGNIRGGKSLFFQHFQGKKITILEGKKNEEFALIGELNENIAQNLVAFIREVIRIKEIK